MTTTPQVEPYRLDPDFEKAVAFLIGTRPTFYARIGYLIEELGLTNPCAKLVVETVHMVAIDSLRNKKKGAAQGIDILDRKRGKTPNSRTILMQALRNRMTEDGRIRLEQIQEVDVYFTPEPREEEDSVVARLKPTVQRRAQQAAMEKLTDEYANRKDATGTQKWLDVARDVGAPKAESTTLTLGPQVFEALEELKALQRLPTGIAELDVYLGGGMMQGQLGMAIGGPGDGKSTWLIQTAAEALLCGRNVAFATLELPASLMSARLMANLTGFSINEITDALSPRSREAAALLDQHEGLGHCIFQDFTPQGTYVSDIFEWVEQQEQLLGYGFEVICVDYADKLISKKADRLYEAMRFVYEDLRLFAEKSAPKRWVWTASQSTRKELVKSKGQDEKRPERTRIHNASDSIEKVRVADLVLGLTREGEYFVIGVEKNRTGESGKVFENMLCDFAKGRVVTLDRQGLGGSLNALSGKARLIGGAGPSRSTPPVPAAARAAEPDYEW